MDVILKNSKTIDLDYLGFKETNIFNKIGIAKIANFSLNHEELKNYYDQISININESTINPDFEEYADKWREIALIKNWEITKKGSLMQDSLFKLRSQFNTGIRYMSFYSAKPGLNLHKHRDLTGNLIQGFIRLHIPIYTHPDCFYLCGTFLNPMKIHAKAGNVYALDTGYLHGVVNKSSINRIHLLIELEVNNWMKGYLPKKTINFYLHFLAFYFFWAPLSILKDPTLFIGLVKKYFKSAKNSFKP